MSEQNLPNLGDMARKMAGNQAIIGQFSDVMAERVDQLASSAAREDWSEVDRIAGQLADDSRRHGYRAVSAMADLVCHEAHRPGNGAGVKRSLIRLIGTCGRVSRPTA